MSTFQFKQFAVCDDHCGMKVCTDSVLLGSWTPIAMREAGFEMPAKVIDLGAGSGLLSLMTAQNFDNAEILALEIDADACADADSNFKASPWSDRLKIANVDALTYTPLEKVDLIICNPPYFTSTLLSPQTARAKARHGISHAYSCESPLIPSRAIELAGKWLSHTGCLAMVTSCDGYQDLIFIAEMQRLTIRALCRVSQTEGKQPTRMLWLISPQCGACLQQELAIRQSDGSYTTSYKELTQEFYL